jgi:hypothetical protein
MKYNFNVNRPSVLVKGTKLDRCSVNDYHIHKEMLISEFRLKGNNILMISDIKQLQSALL